MTNSIASKSLRAAPWFKPAVGVAGVLGLLLLGWLAVPYLININNYRPQIVSQLEQRLGRKVSLGALKLGVWPALQVNVDAVQIGDDPQIAPGDFVQAKAVRLRLNWLSLLRGNPQVAGVELVEPAVTLIKATPQQWNWSTLKPLQETGAETEQAPLNLSVSNGSFTLIDRTLTPPVEKTYSGVNARLDDFSPKRAFDFTLGIIMPGAQAGQLEIKGTAGPLAAQDAAQTPLDARVKLAQVELASLETLLGQQSSHAGKLTLDADLKGKLADGLRAKGDFKAETWRLIEGVEPARAPLEAKFNLIAKSIKNAAGETEFAVQLEQCDLTLGKTAVNITGQINQLPAQPAYDLQIKGDRIALDSLLESAYALGFGPPAGTQASGAASLNVRATGNPQTVALQGQAEVRDLKFQSAQLPQAMQVSELKLKFEPQSISAAPFRSTLSQTTVDFKGLTISEYGQLDKAPRAQLEISTSNAQLGDLLRIAEAFGARPDATGSGTVSLTAAVETSLGAGGALQITGQGKLNGARLQPAQLKKPLEIANADLNFTGDSARIDNLQTQLGTSQATGWVQIKSFAQQTAAFDLKANQINVAELQAVLADSGATTPTKSGKAGGGAPWRADGKLAVGKLQLETLTATNVQSNFTMQNQVMTLDPVTLNVFGGSYQGALRINQAQNPPEVALKGRFGSVDVNQLLSSSGQQSMIYGQADGAIDVRGRGQAGDQLAQSLLGNGSIAISNGKFTSFDLMKQVEVLGKFANLPTGGAGTAFRSLKTNLRFEQGRLTMDALQILMDDLQVNGNGVMQLGAAPSVNYDLLVRLSQGLTKRLLSGNNASAANETGGGSFPIKLPAGLSSVVGNFFMDQGAIALPLKVSGPLKQPSFGLNSNLLQKRATAQFKESLLDQFKPKSAGANADSTEQTEANKSDKPKPAQPKPADLLKGVFDKLRKKEKP
jgi:AsmA protein